MKPNETITCSALHAKLSAEMCARRHLRRFGRHDLPVYPFCAQCSIGASVTTTLVEAGWDRDVQRRSAA